MALKEYRKKRDFRKTPEPAGKRASRAPGRHFVVQRHAASRLHYDFRLELGGVLKSWAVPKGPSLDPSVKALAVEVEDHPLEYADFEGIIPQGQYGGGTVMVWDHGTWEPESDPEEGLRKGRLKFRLNGQKLKGSWALIRMGGRFGAGHDGHQNWLLIKHNDQQAGRDSKLDKSDERARSVISGRLMREIAGDADRVWSSNRDEKNEARKAKQNGSRPPARRKKKAPRAVTKQDQWDVASVPGARQAELPEVLEPQLATLVSSIPSGEAWLHELKFDGYRLLARIDEGKIRLLTRRGNDWTDRFPTAVRALESLNAQSAILDGEIVALDEHGGSDFQRLQNWMQRGDDHSLVYYVFDVPYLDGYELLRTPLVERKQLLARVLLAHDASNEGAIRYSEHVQGQGQQVIDYACRSAMEGVVSKRADSPYQPGRTRTWVKTKCLKRQEFVIGGFTQPQGARTGFGSLLLGYYDNGKLIYCGNVGTGFTEDSLRQLTKRLKQLETDEPAFENAPRTQGRQKATWVRPELVGEVEFTEWTEEGMLRHPSFQGLREDKPPREIGREEAHSTPENGKPRKKAGRNSKRSASDGSLVAGIALSHPERIVYPEQGLTKLDLARYYEAIANWILPYVVNRPLTLVRCPQGRGHHCFYQRHVTESTPQPLRGVTIEEKDGPAECVVLDDLAGLVTLVQMGVLEIHPWGSRADDPERPDRLVFDLDPGEGVAWKAVIEGAKRVRDKLEELGLESFVRTTGGKGLHVVVPLVRRAGWDEAKAFAESVANALVQEEPDKYLATMSKARRRGKVFVDFFRNQRGATAVGSYSTRAREGAPVATPLAWNELTPKLSAAQFTVITVPGRLAKLKKDPWKDFPTVRQSLTAKILSAAKA
jgi:bifunctional non-homologous end joining protein LigD